MLTHRYQELVRQRAAACSMDEVGFRAYSQFDEDGILLYIFALIGFTTRKVVEVCAGIGSESIAANWIINHNFHGLLFEGNEERTRAMWKFFTACPETLITPPVCACAWIESDTIDAQIKSRGFTGEIDLLSIDMDGIDYWVLEAIECVQPRVVVVEYHPGWLADEPMTIPDIKSFGYSPDRLAFCSAPLACHRSSYCMSGVTGWSAATATD